MHNATSFKGIPGKPVQIATCPSGWCRKQMELVKGKVEGKLLNKKMDFSFYCLHDSVASSHGLLGN